MKKLIILFGIIYFQSVYTNAQNPFISLIKYDTLYYGIKNPIKILIQDFSCNEIILRANDCEIIKDSCSFNIIPLIKNGTITIFGYAKNQNDTIQIGSQIFSVKRIPNPDIYFVTQKNENITCKISPNTLIAKSKNSDNFDFEVISFNTSFNNDGGIINEAFNKGPFLNNNFCERYLIWKKSDKIYFNDIRVKCQDGTVRALETLIIDKSFFKLITE